MGLEVHTSMSEAVNWARKGEGHSQITIRAESAAKKGYELPLAQIRPLAAHTEHK